MNAASVPASAAVALVVVLVAAVLLCIHLGLRDGDVPASARFRRSTAQVEPSRIAAGIAVGVAALLATRWVALAAAAAVVTVLWNRILHDRRADEDRARVEAIAKWLEDLRDTLRGSSVGAEDALELVAQRPPAAIREPMALYLTRRRQGLRTEDALGDLAHSLAHPTADAAVAALRLVVGGNAGAARLYRTVTTLAAAARDEVRARERIDRTRAVYQSSMRRLVVIAVALVAYLRIAAADLLAPYGTATGQVVLLLPLSMWACCVAWLRSLCRLDVQRGRAESRAVPA